MQGAFLSPDGSVPVSASIEKGVWSVECPDPMGELDAFAVSSVLLEAGPVEVLDPRALRFDDATWDLRVRAPESIALRVLDAETEAGIATATIFDTLHPGPLDPATRTMPPRNRATLHLLLEDAPTPLRLFAPLAGRAYYVTAEGYGWARLGSYDLVGEDAAIRLPRCGSLEVTLEGANSADAYEVRLSAPDGGRSREPFWTQARQPGSVATMDDLPVGEYLVSVAKPGAEQSPLASRATKVLGDEVTRISLAIAPRPGAEAVAVVMVRLRGLTHLDADYSLAVLDSGTGREVLSLPHASARVLGEPLDLELEWGPYDLPTGSYRLFCQVLALERACDVDSATECITLEAEEVFDVQLSLVDATSQEPVSVQWLTVVSTKDPSPSGTTANPQAARFHRGPASEFALRVPAGPLRVQCLAEAYGAQDADVSVPPGGGVVAVPLRPRSVLELCLIDSTGSVVRADAGWFDGIELVDQSSATIPVRGRTRSTDVVPGQEPQVRQLRLMLDHQGAVRLRFPRHPSWGLAPDRLCEVGVGETTRIVIEVPAAP